MLASLSPFEYEQSGYNHSGWLNANGDTYVMADENWGRDLKVIDVSQLPDLTVIDTIDAGTDHRHSIPHNQIIHEGYLYSSYYYDGLQIWDIRDPQNIERVMHYPTSNIDYRRRYEGAWGVYPFLPSGNILVSDMQEGLFVIKGVKQTILPSIDIDPIQGDWQLAPNPISSNFNIISDLNLADYKIQVYNQSGQLITKLDNSLSYKVNWPQGEYIITLAKENIQSSKKLIIVK